MDRLKEKDYKGGIYSVDIKTGNVSEIKVKQDVSGSNSVDWDKNGENIFYTSNVQIIEHNLDTGNERVIFSTTENLGKGPPIIIRSFDGNSLLFDIVENENEQYLKSVSIESGNVNTITSLNTHMPLKYKKITLSPKEKYIYFTERNQDGGSILSRIPGNGGTPEKIWQSKDPIAGIGIHPDGKQMAISVFEQEVEIRVMENLIKEVEKIYSENE